MDGIEKLKRELNELYHKYHRAELLLEDPLGLVGANLTPQDFELVSYVSASLSYGRVEQIRKSLQNLWLRLEGVGLRTGGADLHKYLVDNSWKTSKKEMQRALKGWVHRFNDEHDILILFQVLQAALKDHKSLGALYAKSKKEKPSEKLQDFVMSLRSYAKDDELEMFRWFACAPSEGSTCKRMVMWLRWMLRSDEIDPGLWSNDPELRKLGIGAHLAFIPMDTHIHRFAMERNLLSRKNPSWKSVEEFSEVLRQVDPTDPARFDFAICHYGMSKFRKKN